MHFATLLFIFPLFQTCSARDGLPVFLIDSKNVMSQLDVQPNPFAKMTTSYFTEIVHKAIKHSDCVVIFIEDKLCSEDISLRDKFGSPYRYMRQALLNKKIKYFPSVSEPYKILNQIFHPQQYNVFFLSPGVKLELRDATKYIYIFFEDGVNETRANSLRKHDGIIEEVYFTVKQLTNGPIVGFYTGKVNPIAAEKVEFVPIKPVHVPRDMGVMIVSDGALFRFSDNVALLEGGEEVGRTEMGVGAPWNWSYVCGEPLSILNTRDGSAITISKYQIQPLRPNARREGDGVEGEGDGGQSQGGEGSAKCFGHTVNCGPYFNTHILSGLLVTFICLAVLMYGVVMLYNCGSNDKFDDPHGKEVVVNAEQH